MNIFLHCKCEKCGKEFVARDISGKRYKIGDEFPHINCGAARVIMIEEMRNSKDCKESVSLYPSNQCYRMFHMTDKEIGKTAREIAERGNTAEVKRNRDGIVVIEVRKKIVKSEETRE